ncbi:MAG: DUF1501 domain-containing protein [Saprospiraceae bacterium]
MNRRNFLRNTGLASATLFVPQFLSGFNQKGLTANGKNLVIIQWSGGNDGLNTVVPYRNDIYYKNRPLLAINKKEVLKLNDELGFNPNMTGLKSLYDDGLVSVINNVGYPNPNRSHFRSMDIWHTASNSDEYWTTGWLGRYLDESCKNSNAHAALEIDDSLVLALKGNEKSGFAVSNPNQLKQTVRNPFLEKIAHHHEHEHEENVAYLYKTLIDTQASANYLSEQIRVYQSNIKYPSTAVANDLKKIAQLIVANTDTKIYYVNLGGFDTHVFQKNQQNRLLKQYSEAIQAFVKDLKQNQKLDDTLIMTFSEFGRRVKQNASQGTDHGKANNVYFIGGKLEKPGIFNENPNLVDLDNGDLQYTVDFRKIYASVLQQWLGVSPKSVLNQNFQPLKLVKM